jgi:predicted MFS family arabinose efflux permease
MALSYGLRGNLALVALGVAGAYITVLLAAIVPQWIAAGVADDTANYIVSAEKAGMMLSSLGLTLVINRWDRRRMAFAFLIALTITNALSALTVAPLALACLRFSCGLSEGAVISIMTAAAVGAGTADRIFGLYLAATLTLSYVFFQAFGALLETGGLPSVFYTMAAVSVAVCALMPFFPSAVASGVQASGASGAASQGRTAWRYLWLALAATALFEACIMAVWNNMVKTATSVGFGADSVSFGMNNGLFAGIAGGLVASLLSRRISRALALAVGVATMMVSLVLVLAAPGQVPFIVVAVLFMSSWMFTLPYFVGAVAALDTTGKSATLSVGFQTGGLMVGPLVSGITLGATHNDYTLLPALGIALLAGCLALVLPSVSKAAERAFENAAEPA